ncbi:uncharacterized protein [Clytia hemisphaerica]|uniref:PDZ domain-containing protein n=1 Tax=Clytia hemisphaerica TaxID=252671 RepID=A0A7M5WVG2_9CNID
MQNIRNQKTKLTRLSSTLLQQRRCLSLTAQHLNNWNPVIRKRNTDVGKHVFEAFSVRTLIDQHPELNGGEIHDVTQGLVKTEMLVDKLQDSSTLPSCEAVEDIFSKIGELKLQKNVTELDAVLREFSEKIFDGLSQREKLFLMKTRHPKHILKTICNSKNMELTVEVDFDCDESECIVFITCGDKELQMRMPKDKSIAEVEHDVCLLLLNDHFSEEFNAFKFRLSEVVDESTILLNPKAPVKREVSLQKISEESFGFTIRGGERKAVRNDEYLQQYITTPVFISDIIAGSPAEKAGLMVGDVLLAVSDHVLQDMGHQQVVLSLKKFANVSSVTFTVKHSKQEVLKYEAEQRFIERQKEKVREEIRCKNMSKWHDAKAKLDPEEYLLERLKEKKKTYIAKKPRQSRRLWDY